MPQEGATFMSVHTTIDKKSLAHAARNKLFTQLSAPNFRFKFSASPPLPNTMLGHVPATGIFETDASLATLF